MKKLALLLFVAAMLAACQPAATTPTAPPAPVEALASSISDLVGVWGGPQDSAIKMEFKANGNFRMFFGRGNQQDTIAEGPYTFDAGKITFTAGGPCQDNATYDAYVTKQNGERISLRAQVVGNDSCSDRAKSLTPTFPFNNP